MKLLEDSASASYSILVHLVYVIANKLETAVQGLLACLVLPLSRTSLNSPTHHNFKLVLAHLSLVGRALTELPWYSSGGGLITCPECIVVWVKSQLKMP